MSNKLKNDLTHIPARKRATILLAIGGYLNVCITVIQGVFLLPLYLNYIGAHTYGLWLASGGVLGMLGLVNFGISNILIQRVAHAYGQSDFSLAGRYFINGMMVCSFIALISGLIGWLSSIWLPDVLNISGSEADLIQQCFLVSLIGMVVAILNECLRSLSQALLRPLFPMMVMVFGRSLGVASSVWMLLHGYGLWAIPLCVVLTEVVIFTLTLFHAFRLLKSLKCNLSLDRKIIKEYFHYSPALFMAKSGNTLSQETEPLFITIFISAEVTTFYMVFRKAADMVFLIISVFNGASDSAFSHLVGEASQEKIKDIAEKLVFIVLLFSLIGFSMYICANSAFVSLWVGEQYVLDSSVGLLIGVGFFIRAIRGKVLQILSGFGDFTYPSVILFLEGVIKVILTVVLLQFFTEISVPIALILSSFPALLLLTYRLKNRISYKTETTSTSRVILSVIAVLSISTVLEYFLNSVDTWNMFFVSLPLCALCLCLVFILINWNLCLLYLKKGSR